MLYEDNALFEARTRGVACEALGCLQMQCDAGQHLSKLVVQFTGQVAPLLLLNCQQSAGEMLQAVGGVAKSTLGTPSLGDILVDDDAPDDQPIGVADGCR